MVIYLFRDKRNDEVFAFSTDVTGRNIPRAAANTEWMFIQALNTLKFPNRGTSATSNTCWTTCARMTSTCSKASSLRRRLWGKRSRRASCVTKPPPSAVAEAAESRCDNPRAQRPAPASHLLLLVAAACFPSVIW
jgi:hypothetical protein